MPIVSQRVVAAVPMEHYYQTCKAVGLLAATLSAEKNEGVLTPHYGFSLT